MQNKEELWAALVRKIPKLETGPTVTLGVKGIRTMFEIIWDTAADYALRFDEMDTPPAGTMPEAGGPGLDALLNIFKGKA